jgi:RNA polymerase sigma-70 factor (ECF subfamily)
VTDREQPDAQRHAEEFTELYAACERRLYVYIVALIGNPFDAHDLLQETSLILWQKFHQFQRGTNFLAWAREVARLRILRFRRMHANEMFALQPQAIEALTCHFDAVPDGPSRFYGDVLADCVNALHDGDRELIRLRYSSDVSVQAMADRLSRSANAVSQSLARIRRLLRKCVEAGVRQKEADGGPVE